MQTVPDAFGVPLYFESGKTPRVFAHRQMCFLRLSEMFGRAQQPSTCQFDVTNQEHGFKKRGNDSKAEASTKFEFAFNGLSLLLALSILLSLFIFICKYI